MGKKTHKLCKTSKQMNFNALTCMTSSARCILNTFAPIFRTIAFSSFYFKFMDKKTSVIFILKLHCTVRILCQHIPEDFFIRSETN